MMRRRTGLSVRKRWAILKRDEFACVYCGAKAADGVRLHVDHRVAVSRGGLDDEDNLVTACVRCNLGKSDSSLEPIAIEPAMVRAAISSYDYRPQRLRSLVRGLQSGEARLDADEDRRLKDLIEVFLEEHADASEDAALRELVAAYHSPMSMWLTRVEPEKLPARLIPEYRLLTLADQRSQAAT